MKFLRPDLMQWWLILPVLVAAWGINYRYTRSVRLQMQVAKRFALLSRRSSRILSAAILATCLIAAAALVFSLMRPQLVWNRRMPVYQRQDLIIILDRSVSMRAHDIAPSRLARATLEIKKFLQNKPDSIDRIGLVSFADEPIVLSYLTRDIASIFFYLDWSDGDTDPLFGTNIGAALKSAMDVAQKDDKPTKKTFLLVSDGEDHGDELEAALSAVRAKGYPIYCIGIGSQKEVPIPVADSYGVETNLTDDNGELIKTKFEESTLRAIAETTGGQFIRSSTGYEMEQGMTSTLGRQRTLVGWKTSTEFSDMYRGGLAVAGVSAAALWLLL